KPCGDLAHDRTLAAIAIAAAAENHNDTAGGERSNGLKHVLQSVGLVGIIDIDRGAVGRRPDEFKPPRSALQPLESGQRLVGGDPRRDCQPRRNESVGDLEITRKRQVYLIYM